MRPMGHSFERDQLVASNSKSWFQFALWDNWSSKGPDSESPLSTILWIFQRISLQYPLA